MPTRRPPPPASPLASDEPDDAVGVGPLYHLVYCSRATAAADGAALDRIVAVARRNNALHGITGLLSHGSGLFFQWLEGPRDAVQALMQTLRADPRHTDVLQLSDGEEVRDRMFPTWDMEPVDAAQLRDVLRDALEQAQDAGSRRTLQQMLALLDRGPIQALGRD